MATGSPDALMQRAAFGLATTASGLIRQGFGRVAGVRLAVVAGSGNNGGDALFAAATLARRGVSVRVVPVGPTIHAGGLAAVLREGGRVCQATGADVALDAVVGIGGSGPLRPSAAAARDAVAADLTIAVDLPSGVHCDTGWVPGEVYRADHTVTFGCLKQGIVVPPGCFEAGTVHLVDIGLPLPAARTSVVEAADVAVAFRRPGTTDHKYSRGVVAVCAGSKMFPGAGLLCLAGARRAGSGMVRYEGPGGPALLSDMPDVVAAAGRTDAWVVGPGLADEVRLPEAMARAMDSGRPAVFDAEALSALAADDRLRATLAAAEAPVVLTPHEGEFARMGFAIGDDRVAAVRSAAAQWGAVVLLKGTVTIVASPGGAVFVNRESSANLATAGSGDVLAGMIGAVLAAHARDLDEDGAARLAAVCALVHGRAGRAAGWPATATDIADSVPVVLREMVG